VTAEANAPFNDPVLGAFDFVLTGITPDLKSTARDKIIIGKNGKKIRLTVPTKDGNTLAVNVLRPRLPEVSSHWLTERSCSLLKRRQMSL